MRWPFRITSISTGAEPGSKSQVSCRTIWKCQRYLPVSASSATIELPKRLAPWPIAAVEVIARRADRQVDEPERGIDADETPGVRSGAVLPAVPFPRVVTELARLRHVVELPHHLAGPQIPGARVAGIPKRRRFLHARAGDDEILVDLRRRRQADIAVREAVGDPLAEIHHAVVAERRHGHAGARIEADEQPAGHEQDHRRRGAVARPVLHAAIRHGGGTLVNPELPCRCALRAQSRGCTASACT